MKRFILKSGIFSLISFIVILTILSFADGYTDPFYIRFTTPKQESLIIGTSRAAQGLQPNVFNEICNVNLYNYAFTIAHSPFGETYLNSIKKKINKSSNSGIFIVTVDPWSISSKTDNPNDSKSFRENNRILGNTPAVNINPNFLYLLNNYSSKYYTIFTKKNRNPLFLHQNGWLEVSIKLDSSDNNKRIESKVDAYKSQMLPAFRYSSLRFEYLKKTIEFLSDYGEVYLVRLPIHNKMMEIDDQLMPDFNHKISQLIPMTNGYLDMTPSNQNYAYTDGNHLHRVSSKRVSEVIANWIVNQRKKTVYIN